jgi:hypothetical protein
MDGVRVELQQLERRPDAGRRLEEEGRHQPQVVGVPEAAQLQLVEPLTTGAAAARSRAQLYG